MSCVRPPIVGQGAHKGRPYGSRIGLPDIDRAVGNTPMTTPVGAALVAALPHDHVGFIA